MQSEQYLSHDVAAADSLGMVDTITGGTVATIVDAGTTIFNSFTPESMNVSTTDLLSRVSSNALQVYQEHPDAVRTASFIAGSLAPIGISSKIMTKLRSGEKGFSWFTEAGQATRLTEVESAYANGLGVNTAIKQTQNLYYAHRAANAVADTVAAELAINIAMNAHPMMEDYRKDWGTNFLLGVGIGSAISAPIYMITARSAMDAVKKPIESQLNTILSTVQQEKQVSQAATQGMGYQTRTWQAERLQGFLDANKAGELSTPLSQRTVEGLELAVEKYKAKAIEDFEKMLPEDMAKTLSLEQRNKIMGVLKGEMFKEVDTLAYFTPSGRLTTKAEENIFTTNWFAKRLTKEGIEKEVAEKVAYSPVFDSMVSFKGMHDVATVADLNLTMEALEKSTKQRFYGRKIQDKSQGDIELNLGVLDTAEIQGEYVKAFHQFDTMESKEFFNSMWTTTPGDLPTLQAIQARLMKERAAGNTEQVEKFKITLSYEAPSFKAAQQKVLLKAGVDPNFTKELEIIGAKNNWKGYSLYNPYSRESANLSDSATKEVRNWISYFGAKGNQTLRLGALFMQNAPLTGESLEIAKKGKLVIEELRNNPNSIALRERFNSVADAEGYIYLYRGLKREAKGHTGLESYTTSAKKAKEFGVANLYKVKVDDIVGGITDAGKGEINSEILVLNPTREIAGISPKELRFDTPTSNITPELAHGAIEVTGKDLGTHIGNTALRLASEMMQDGRTIESIALRTGVPLKTLKEGREALKLGVGTTHFDSIQKVEEAMNPLNKAFVMQSNVTKMNNIRSVLNASDAKSIDSQILEGYLKSANHTFVRDMGYKITDEEMKVSISHIERELQDLLTSQLGNTLFRSADSVMEKMGAAGVLITNIGRKSIDIANQAKKEFTEVLSTELSKIAKTPTELYEFATAVNVLSGISGRTIYKAGKFWSIENSPHSIDELLKATDEEFLSLATIPDKTGQLTITAEKFAGAEYKVVQENVDKALKQFQEKGRVLYELANVRNKTLGIPSITDRGFWIPANNPSGKQIAYVFNTSDHSTTMLMAKTVEELNEKAKGYYDSLPEDLKSVIRIVKKGEDQELYNKIHGRHDPLYMGVADLSKRHGGSSQAPVVDASTEFLADLIQGYDYHVNNGISNLIKLQLDPILTHLDTLSTLSQSGYSQGLTGQVAKVSTTKPVDGGAIIKKILLGKPLLSESPGWEKFQSGFQMVSDRVLRETSTVLSSFLGKTTVNPEEWKNLSKEMEKIGMVNPYQKMVKEVDSLTGVVTSEKWMADLDLGAKTFAMQSGLARESLTPRVVALGNALTATMVLRVAELAQPLVNMLSLPILTSAAVGRRLESSFMGATIDPNAKFLVHEAMYDGIRLMNHPELGAHKGGKFGDLARQNGLLDLEWRDVNGIMHHVRSLEKSGVSKIEEFLDGDLIRELSTYADWSEKMVRQVTFFTGMAMAKKAYPGLGEAGLLAFTRRFMDEAIGNYAAAQRPVMFQGTVGMAMGLFQTYMLTLGQAMYRGIEQKNYRMLGQMLLTQQGIFGSASLPGFHQVSQVIGANFSDNHYDLETGTFRAIGDDTSTLLLYGLPSQLAGVTTRGDIQPRVPDPFNAANSIAAVNMTKQFFTAADRVVTAAFTADGNTGKAMLEALSLQSLSRPVARVSELLSGRSITSRGNVIDENTWMNKDGQLDYLGVAARVFATRPIAEIKAREADHLNNYYGAKDRDNRDKVTFALKSYIGNGNLSPEITESLGERYLRNGGSPTGWRSAVNTAIGQSLNPGSSRLEKEFGKDSPFNRMIEDL